MKILNVVIGIISLSMLLSCSNTMESSEELLVVKDYVRAVETGDYNFMTEVLDDSYFGFGPSFNDSISKDQALMNWKENVANLYESITYQKSQFANLIISKGTNKGRWVSNWAELEIIYQSGAKATVWANTIYQVSNGKIIKSYTFYNEADVLRQISNY